MAYLLVRVYTSSERPATIVCYGNVSPKSFHVFIFLGKYVFQLDAVVKFPLPSLIIFVGKGVGGKVPVGEPSRPG